MDYHILQLQALFNVCAHTPLILWVFAFYIFPMIMNAQEPMMQFVTFFYHYVRCWLSRGTRATTCVSLSQDQLLSSTNQHYVHQRWHSHFNSCCHCQPQHLQIYFPNFEQLKDLLSSMKFKPKERAITNNTPLINSSF